jgi:hypothetical protein
MFILLSHDCMGAMVLFLLFSSHEISLCESAPSATLIVGLVEGQFTDPGAYPLDGEFGRARSAIIMPAARASAANTSGEASLGRTIAAVGNVSVAFQKGCVGSSPFAKFKDAADARTVNNPFIVNSVTKETHHRCATRESEVVETDTQKEVN